MADRNNLLDELNTTAPGQLSLTRSDASLQAIDSCTFLFNYQGRLLDMDDAARRLTGFRSLAIPNNLRIGQLFQFPIMRNGFAAKSLRLKGGTGKWLKARLTRFDGEALDVRVEIRTFSRHMIFVVSEPGISLAYLLATSVTSTIHGIVCSDPDGKIIYANLPFLSSFGYGSPRELMGRSLWKLLPIPEARKALEADPHKAQNWDGHFVVRKKDGTAIDAYVSFLSMLDPEGRVAAIRVLVTDRTRLFTALDGQNPRVAAENSMAAVILLNRDGEIVYSSPASERISGYSPKERVGRTIFDLFVGPSIDQMRKGFEEILAHPGESRPMRLQLRRKDGSTVWVEDIVTNLLDDPSVGAIVVTAYDVSKQMQAEEQLRMQELAMEASIDGFLICDADHLITYANSASARLLGYTKSELQGRKMCSLLALEPGTVLPEGEWTDYATFRRADGTLIELRTSSSPIEGGRGRVATLFQGVNLNPRPVEYIKSFFCNPAGGLVK